MDFTKVFRAKMASDGIIFNGDIIADGVLHRIYIDGDAHGSSNGWYVAYADGIPSGAYGCWKRNISKTWCAKQKHEVSQHEWQTYVKRMVDCKHQSKQKMHQKHAETAALANIVFDSANQKNVATHPYLRLKQVPAYGLRMITREDQDTKQARCYKGTLLVPCYNAKNELVNLERIYFDKKDSKFQKRPLRGAQRNRTFYTIGKFKSPHDIIYIAEGFATAATIHEATDAYTVVSFNCGNLLHVTTLFRQKYPHTHLVIIADDDKWNIDPKLNHSGLKAAKEACSSIKNTTHLLPDFRVLKLSEEKLAEVKPTDINDLFVHLLANGLNRTAALEQVRQQLTINFDEEIMSENVKSVNQDIEIDNAIAESKPKPLPNSLPPVMPFDPEMLPSSIKDYILDIADRQQSPVDFVAVTAVCALSALLGRKILICPKQHDDWKITPNLWGAVIGRPSTMKSPAMRAALEPLYHIEAEAAKEFEEIKKNYELDQEIAALSKFTAKEKAKNYLKESNSVKAKAALEEANSLVNDKVPTRKRLIVNDSSVEKLGELLNENPNGLILIRQELAGWLSKLMKEEFQTDRAFYIECFDGTDSFVYDRIGRGTIDIKNLTLSVIGGIQPSRINPLIRDSIKGVSDDGLVQRLQVTVWPDDVGSWKWVDRAPNKEARDKYMKAFYDLNGLSIDTNDGKPPCFRFTKKAQKLFIQWMKELQKNARADDIHPALESHLLKMPKIIASLALLFELLEGGKKTVGLKSIAQALDWADYLKSHAKRLYSSVNNPGLTCAHLILKRLDKLNDEFTARDIHRKGWSGLSEVRDIEEGLLCLTDYCHITSREIPPTISGGRPTVIYTKNKKYTNRNA